MPIVSGDIFTMSIATTKPANNLSIVVYNMFGSVVSTSSAATGINFMSFDLPAGIYTYNLLSDNTPVKSGKLSIIK